MPLKLNRALFPTQLQDQPVRIEISRGQKVDLAIIKGVVDCGLKRAVAVA
jgi:hypothetical protein